MAEVTILGCYCGNSRHQGGQELSCDEERTNNGKGFLVRESVQPIHKEGLPQGNNGSLICDFTIGRSACVQNAVGPLNTTLMAVVSASPRICGAKHNLSSPSAMRPGRGMLSIRFGETSGMQP